MIYTTLLKNRERGALSVAADTSSFILLYFYLAEFNKLPSASRLKLHLVPGAGKLLGDFHSKTSKHSQRTMEEQEPAWHPELWHTVRTLWNCSYRV